jgi:hypothetical protein
MTAICTRLVAFAGPQPDPLDANDPQLALVQGRVGVNIDPILTKNGPAPLDGATDFWDVLVNPHFDKNGYVILYEAEMQAEGGEIIVKRDLFGPGDYPHTWAGWPIPGDEDKPPEKAPSPPKMTEKQQEALDRIYAKRKSDTTKTIHAGKVSNWGEAPAKKHAGKK